MYRAIDELPIFWQRLHFTHVKYMMVVNISIAKIHI